MPDLEEPRYSDRYVEAFAFASEVHRLHARKGGEDQPNGERVPYLAHLMAVSSLVWEGGGDEDQAIAALLHDAVEDHPEVVSLALIAERFGPRVADMVGWATDTTEQPKPPWRPRKEAYVKRLAKVDRDAVLVIAADKLHNVRSTVDDLRHEGLRALDRFSTSDPGDLRWYYESVSDRLSEKAKTNVVVRRLRREVRQMAKLLDKLAANPEKPAKAKGKGKAKAGGEDANEAAPVPVEAAGVEPELPAVPVATEAAPIGPARAHRLRSLARRLRRR